MKHINSFRAIQLKSYLEILYLLLIIFNKIILVNSNWINKEEVWDQQILKWWMIIQQCIQLIIEILYLIKQQVKIQHY